MARSARRYDEDEPQPRRRKRKKSNGSMARRVMGGFMLAFGTLLACAILYMIFTGEKGNGRPFGAFVFVGALFYVGGKWIKGETAE